MPSNDAFRFSINVGETPIAEYEREGKYFVECNLYTPVSYQQKLSEEINGELETQSWPVTPYEIMIETNPRSNEPYYYRVFVDGVKIKGVSVRPNEARAVKGFRDGTVIRELLFAMPRFASDSTDRLCEDRVSKVGQIEVECYSAKLLRSEWKLRSKELLFTQANKKDSSKVTKGQFTMTTSKAGRVIKPRAEFRCVDHWMPTELKSSLKVFYRMGNELREMGFKLRPFKMLAPAGDTSKQEDSGEDIASHVSSVTARSSTTDARLGRKRPHTSMSVDVMSLEDDAQPGSSSQGYRGSQDNTQPGPSSRGYRDSEDNTQPGPSSRGYRDERDHTQPDSSSRGYRNSQSRKSKLSQNETMSANSGQHGVRSGRGFRTISHDGQSNLRNYEKTVKIEVDADGWPTADIRNQATEEDDGNEIVVIDITSSDDEGSDDMFIVEQPRVETEAIDVEIDDEDKSLNRSGELTGKKTIRESTGMSERKRNVKECRVKIRTRNKTDEIEKRIDEEKIEMEIGNRIDEEESKRVDDVKNLNDIAIDGTNVNKGDTSDALEPADHMETEEIADKVKMIAKEENVGICKQGEDKVVDAGMSKENDVETNDPGDTEVDKGVSKRSVEEINAPKEPSANDINEYVEESPSVVVIPRSINNIEVSNVTNLDLVKGNEISEQEEGVDEPSQITEQEGDDVSQIVQPYTDVECDAADTIKSSEVASELSELPIDGLELPRKGQELNNLSNQASGDATNGPTESEPPL